MIELFVLATFPFALVAGALVWRYPGFARIAALWPALLTAMLSAGTDQLAQCGPPSHRDRVGAVPGTVALVSLDGLGLLFALLITGIGTLVVLYASAYLGNHPQAGRFYASLFAFMGAMLGVALSDNVLALFVFWELTGFTSFLLIGFEHDRADARSAALQALIVTGAGGLALLAAGVLLVDVYGTANLSMMESEQRLDDHASRLCRGRRPGAAGGVHKVGAGAVSLLAAERDGSADAGQCLPALGHHGEGGRVSDREDDTDPRRDGVVDDRRHRRRCGHHARRARTDRCRKPI